MWIVSWILFRLEGGVDGLMVRRRNWGSFCIHDNLVIVKMHVLKSITVILYSIHPFEYIITARKLSPPIWVNVDDFSG